MIFTGTALHNNLTECSGNSNYFRCCYSVQAELLMNLIWKGSKIVESFVEMQKTKNKINRIFKVFYIHINYSLLVETSRAIFLWRIRSITSLNILREFLQTFH